MKVTQEKLPQSQVGLTIVVPPEMSKSAYEQVINKYTRLANIPGFRKGKVPRNILIQKLGADYIKAVALEELIQDTLEKVITGEEIKALSQCELVSDFEQLIKAFQPGEELSFVAKVDVEPEVTIKDYVGLNIQAEKVEYDASQIDKVLEKKRQDMATLVPVEGRPAQAGDMTTIDFLGKFADGPEAGTEIPGGQAVDFEVELTPGKFIEGFTESIIGMNPGDIKEVSLTFPESYGSQELAGKNVIFTITLHDIKEKELPELDDDFAQEVSDFDTLEELRKSLEEKFTKENDQANQSNKDNAILQKIGEIVEVEIPETMIKEKVNQLLTQTAMELSRYYDFDVKKFFAGERVEQMRQESRPQALEILRQSLALQAVSQQENITVDDQEIEAEVKELLQEFAEDRETVDVKKVREFVRENQMKEKTLKWLEEKANIELLPAGSLQKAEDTTVETDNSETSEVTIDTTVTE